MTDYRRFLASAASAERRVLPYFGGPYVFADRLLRVTAPVDPGFWLFELAGRRARPVEPAEPPDLSGLPAVRGYSLAGRHVGYLIGDGGRAELLAIGPADEPLPFTPLVARRWPGGELLHDTADFETGVEDEVRDAYERRVPLSDLRGVPAALRACYGYTIAFRAAAERGVPLRAAEVRPHVRYLAEEGEPAAELMLDVLAAERAAGRPAPPPARRQTADHTAPEPPRDTPEPAFDGSGPVRGDPWPAHDPGPARERRAGRRRPSRAEARRERVARRRGAGWASDSWIPDADGRVATALEAAGAAARGNRRLADGLLEVRYDFEGERFVTIVDARTLQVVDAGICLDGADAALTLESLPSAIREAVRTGQLYVTRH